MAAPVGPPQPTFEEMEREEFDAFHKKLHASNFEEDDERTEFDAVLGNRAKAPPLDDDDDETTTAGMEVDGVTPLTGLTAKDVWRAIQPPIQSRPGRRSPSLYRKAIDQFAAGHNPRYEPDGQGKPRAHIFVWDVTRAMHAELPHFLGVRELNLAQTVDWLRSEGPMHQWRRADAQDAIEAANQGLMVVAVPKDVKIKVIGVARPGKAAADGKPLLSAAGRKRGNGLSVLDALGVLAAEYFIHP